MSEKCTDTRKRLTNQLNSWKRNTYIFSLVGLLVGLTFGIAIPALVDNPIENPDTFNSFEFGAIITDFYIQNIDNSNINYSYFINQFTITGARFSQEEWNIFKEYNLTNSPVDPLGEPFFYEITIFGASGMVNETYAQSCDNNAWEMPELPILIITSITLDIYQGDYGDFDNSEIILMEYEEFDKYENYRFKSDSLSQNMYVQINGLSYNYTSHNSVNLFMRYNNVPLIVPAYY